jgi:hypothetical protein
MGRGNSSRPHIKKITEYNKEHLCLIAHGYQWSRFEEPEYGWKRKYWKVIESGDPRASDHEPTAKRKGKSNGESDLDTRFLEN